jgi:hypothetical protein
MENFTSNITDKRTVSYTSLRTRSSYRRLRFSTAAVRPLNAYGILIFGFKEFVGDIGQNDNLTSAPLMENVVENASDYVRYELCALQIL